MPANSQEVPADSQDPAALSLEAAISQARARNETVAIAAARLDRAQAISRQAYATLVPGITLTGTYTRRQAEVTRLVNGEELTIQARDGLQAIALAEATLFDARAFPLVRSARRAEEAQALESSELVRGLEFEVAQAYFAVLSTQRLVEAARRRIEVAEATVSDADIRRDAGLAALNDVTRTRLEEATARLTLTEAETAVRNTRYLLSFLIGESGAVTSELVEPTASAALPASDLATLTATARAGRADLAALFKRAESDRQRALFPRLGFVPSLDGRGTYRWTNEAGLSGNEETFDMSAVLTWELFDGGERAGLAEQFDAEARETALAATALERRIALEVSDALADVTTATAALGQAEAQAEVAEQNAVEVRERFRYGLASALESADAAVAQFEAEAERERQRFALRLAELELRRALGQAPLDYEEAAR